PVELLLLLLRRVVADRLVIDRVVMHVRPRRLFHREPVAERLQSPVEEPLRLLLLRRDEADDVFVEAGRSDVRLDVGDEAVLVLLAGDLFDGRAHDVALFLMLPNPMTCSGITPRVRSPRVTCSNAPLMARLMPNMKRRDGQAIRIAHVA